MCVAQAPDNSPALREGSVLCLEDRKPLGRIEEILGPVVCPIYALRYAGDGGEMPMAVQAGSRVCSVDRFSHRLEESDLSAKVMLLVTLPVILTVNDKGPFREVGKPICFLPSRDRQT